MNGPIYLAGPSRSGKTLVRWMLSCHPRIAVSRRTEMWPRFHGRFGDLARPQNLERCLRAMSDRPQIAALRIDIDALRSSFARGPATYERLFALAHDAFAERQGKPRWGDQSPGIERFADEILATDGRARFVHLVRDPRDCYAAELSRRPRRLGGVGSATSAWLASVRRAERNADRHPQAYRIVRYETLVERPEETARELCRFLEEDYAPSMTTLEGVSRYDDRRAASPDGAAITTAFVSSYRDAVTASDLAHIQRAAGGAMRRHGYRPDPVSLSPGDRIRCAAAWPVGVTRIGLRRSAVALGERHRTLSPRDGSR